MVHVLMGLPAGAPAHFEGQITAMMGVCFEGEEADVVFCRSESEFVARYEEHFADLVIALDDLRYGSGYCGAVGRREGEEKFLVVVPDGLKGNALLLDAIRRGFYNIMFQSDFGIARIRSLMERNRSLDDVLTYCGVDFRPAAMSSVPEVVHGEGGALKASEGSIKRRYLGNGIALVELYGKDADLLMGKGAGSEDFDLSIFSGYEMTQEEKQARMPVRTYAVEEEWVDVAKTTLKNRFVKMGLLFFNGNDSSFTEEEKRKRILEELEHMKFTGDKAQLVLESFLRDINSYGRLDQLIHDKDVSDIRMMDFETVNVQSRGKWYRTNVRFSSKQEYENFIQHICNKNNVPFNWTYADTVFPDEHSFPGECMLRNSFTNKNLNVNRTMSGHLRITRKVKKLSEELVREGFMNKLEAGLLGNAARNRQSMIICGGSGSGKTILLNNLIEYFPRDVCGEIVQESSELFAPNHLNIKSSNSIEGKDGDAKAAHDLKALAEKALLRNTEVFIIGEIKGDEAADFYSASRTSCVYTTIHANNCFGAIPRAAELALAARAASTKEEIMAVLARTIRYVVYCEKYQVKQIAEVKGYDEREHDIRYVFYDFHAKEAM